MTGKNTLRARSVPIEVVIAEWPPVAIDTNHLLPQHLAIFESPREPSKFAHFLWGEIQVLRAATRRIVEIASRGTALQLVGTQEVLHQVGR